MKTKKVRTTLAITEEARDTMLDNGYCSERGMGEFLSQLVMEHHARVQAEPKPVAPNPPAEQDNVPAHQLPYDLPDADSPAEQS